MSDRAGGDEGPEGGAGGASDGRDPSRLLPVVEETITTEVPALMAGLRVDRGVAMVANVSRSVAAELVEAGRVLVDGVDRRGRAPSSA